MIELQEKILKRTKKFEDRLERGAKSVVNEFFKYGGYVISDKLLKITNMIFEEGEVLSHFRKTLIKPLYKKGEKSERINYGGFS